MSLYRFQIAFYHAIGSGFQLREILVRISKAVVVNHVSSECGVRYHQSRGRDTVPDRNARRPARYDT